MANILGPAIAEGLSGLAETEEKYAARKAAREKNALNVYTKLLREGWTPITDKEMKRGVSSGQILEIGPLGQFLKPPDVSKSDEFKLKMQTLETRQKLADKQLRLAEMRRQGEISDQEYNEKMQELRLRIQEAKLGREQARGEREEAEYASTEFADVKTEKMGGNKVKLHFLNPAGREYKTKIVDLTKPPSIADKRQRAKVRADYEQEIDNNPEHAAVESNVYSLNDYFLPDNSTYGWIWKDPGRFAWGDDGAKRFRLPQGTNMKDVRDKANFLGVSVHDLLVELRRRKKQKEE